VADPGNVLSRGVQFAEYKRLRWTALTSYDSHHPESSFFDWYLPALNDDPKTFDKAEGLDIDEDELPGEDGEPPEKEKNDKELVPVTNRWIYAFEAGYGDISKIAILAREYHADDKGALTFVDGNKRRLVDATDDSEPKGQPIADAGLPLTRQTEHCHYVFVATRGRLCRDAIRDIESRLTGQQKSWRMPSIYRPINLGDSLQKDPNGKPFAPVFDPLTLAENLGRSYRRALNWAINLAVPHKNNPKREEMATDVLKYQLGAMMRDNLLRDGNDPQQIRPHLVNNGDRMLHFLDKREAALSMARQQGRLQAAAVVLFFKSDIWSVARGWYHGPIKCGPTTTAAKTIGHMFLASCADAHRRLEETGIGQRYLKKVVHEDDGPRAWFFEPPPKKEKTEEEENDDEGTWHQIRRKSATAAIVGIAEFGPALKVARNVHHADAMMRRTLKKLFPLNTMEELFDHQRQRLVEQLLKLSPEGSLVKANYDKVHQDLTHWIDDNKKAHWPHGTRLATASELLSKLLGAIEVYNLAEKMQRAIEELAKQDAARRVSTFDVSMRITLAGLDVLVAAEEPISEYGLHMAKGTRVEKIVGKVLKPTAFKILGGVSSLIEVYVALVEAQEAAERGEQGVKWGYRIVAGGAGLAAVGFFWGAFGNPGLIASAAALGLVVIGIAAVAIGYIVVSCFTTTAWQSFAAHSEFGSDRGDGKTNWSGSEFSEWHHGTEGLELQIKSLTAMLCGFAMNGEGIAGGGSSVRIAFGGLPINAKLQIQFELTFDNGGSAKVGYLVDLVAKPTVSHHWGVDDPECRQLVPTSEKGRLTTLIVAPKWPDGRRVVTSQCSAVIQYAPPSAEGEEGAATGTIPVHGHFSYKVIESGALGIAHTNVLESIDAQPPPPH
jgi:hypothetical protein